MCDLLSDVVIVAVFEFEAAIQVPDKLDVPYMILS